MENTTLEIQLREFCDSFHKNRRKYANFALRFVHNPVVVEDLVSDSFASFWGKRDDIPRDTDLEAYFYTIIKNKCLNWLRNKEVEYKARDEITDTSYRLLQYDIAALESYDPNLIFTNEIRNILQEELNKMPAITRNVFTDSRFENMTYEEIAEKHHISIWKVAREIQTTINILRVSLRDYLPVCRLKSRTLQAPLNALMKISLILVSM